MSALTPPSEVLTKEQAIRYFRESMPINIGCFLLHTNPPRANGGGNNFVMILNRWHTKKHSQCDSVAVDMSQPLTKARMFDLVERYLDQVAAANSK